MQSQRWIQHAALVLCVTALAACASKVRLDDLPPVDSRSTSVPTGGNTGNGVGNTALGAGTNNGGNNGASNPANNGSGTSTAIATVQAAGNNTMQPQAGLLAQRSIYFDYDSYIIRDDAKAVLNAHAQNLGNNRNQKIALEGHTDERGGREYNLALGQKRANAVQQALQLLGVSETQMEAVSFGKEKPKATGSNESDYAENRRADIQYR